MTDFIIDESARKDLAVRPQLSGGPAAAQLQRFLALEDILIGFGEGIDGARLEAGLTWAKHGDAQANRDALVPLFASRWIAAQEEGEWAGDAMVEGARDLDELTAVAAAIATRESTRPEWIGVDAAADAPQEFKDWAARFNALHRADELHAAAKAMPGATYQKSETITLTASGDETCAELKQHMASVLPQGFRFAGGLDRIRKGDPVPGTDRRLQERDQQAHAAFVAHHPRQPLDALRAEQEGGAS
ncbi:hypothetical protein ACWIDJ_01620 [Brevundimonas naejangsanensis]